MDLSLPPITPEMRAALQASGGAPIQVHDPETLRVYTISEQPIEITLDEKYLQQAIDEGLADVDAGRVADGVELEQLLDGPQFWRRLLGLLLQRGHALHPQAGNQPHANGCVNGA